MLIVEDDPIILMTAAHALRQAGFAVVEAETAEEGAKMLATSAEPVDVVFSDIETPGALDGLALARLIEARWPAIRVILTSGRVSPTADALPACARFLAKPYDVTRVSRLVRELVEG